MFTILPMCFEHFLKCLIAFLIPLKFLLWDSAIFVYFSWRPLSVNLLGCQECAFYSRVLRKKRHTLIPTHSAVQSSKRFKPCLWLGILLWQSHRWIGKKHKQQKSTNCFMVLVIWPSSTLKFLFVFDFK